MYYTGLEAQLPKLKKIIFTEEKFKDAFVKPTEKLYQNILEDLHEYISQVEPDWLFEKVIKKSVDQYNRALNDENIPRSQIIFNKYLRDRYKGTPANADDLVNMKLPKDFDADTPDTIKIFEYDYCPVNDKSRIKNIFTYFRDFRNDTDAHSANNEEHKEEYYKEYFENGYSYRKLRKSIADIPKLLASISEHADINVLNEICNAYKSASDQVYKYLNTRLKGGKRLAHYRKTQIELSEFYGYFCIVPDESVCLGKYGRFIEELSAYCDVVLTSTAARMLRNIRANREGKDSAVNERAKDIFRVFEKMESSSKIIGIQTKEEFEKEKSIAAPVFYEDQKEELFALLDERIKQGVKRKRKICMITENEKLVADLWRLIKTNECLKDCIVVRPDSITSAMVNHGIPHGTLQINMEIDYDESENDTEAIVDDVDEEAVFTPSTNETDADIVSKPTETVPAIKNVTTEKSNNTYESNQEESREEYKSLPAEDVSDTKSNDHYIPPFIPIPQTDDRVWLKLGDDNFAAIKLTEKLSEGGEGAIYKNDIYSKRLIKIYKRDKMTKQQADKIKTLVNYAKNTLKEKIHDDMKICWPIYEVWDPTQKYLVGFAMNNARNCVTLEDIIFDIIEHENPRIKDRYQMVSICIKIAERFEELHNVSEILMGDINLNNILVRLDEEYTSGSDFENTEVYFVDVDSYQFKNYLCPVGKPDFTSPEMHRKLIKNSSSYKNVKRTMNDEKFAMATLFFYFLTLGEFPYEMNSSNTTESIMKGKFSYYENDEQPNRRNQQVRRNFIWQNYTEEIRKMFNECFGKMHNYKNYSEKDWKNAFDAMQSQLKDKRLSNEIEPMSALQSENDYFTTFNCITCGKVVETTAETQQSDSIAFSEPRCKRCIQERSINQQVIVKVRCKECGAVFTVNRYDILEPKNRNRNKAYFNDMNLGEFICPDCKPNINYSRSSEMDINEKLNSTLNNAIFNLLENM